MTHSGYAEHPCNPVGFLLSSVREGRYGVTVALLTHRLYPKRSPSSPQCSASLPRFPPSRPLGEDPDYKDTLRRCLCNSCLEERCVSTNLLHFEFLHFRLVSSAVISFRVSAMSSLSVKVYSHRHVLSNSFAFKSSYFHSGMPSLPCRTTSRVPERTTTSTLPLSVTPSASSSALFSSLTLQHSRSAVLSFQKQLLLSPVNARI